MLLGFAYAMSWMGVFFATVVPTVRSRSGRVHVDLPADVPVQRLRPASRACPAGCSRSPSGTRVSTLTSSRARDLFGNPNPFPSDALPGEHPFLVSVVWIVDRPRRCSPRWPSSVPERDLALTSAANTDQGHPCPVGLDKGAPDRKGGRASAGVGLYGLDLDRDASGRWARSSSPCPPPTLPNTDRLPSGYFWL